MKFIVILILFVANGALADRGDDQHVKDCLKHWGKTPFNAKNLNYKTMKSQVSVFGAGGDLKDEEKTKGPRLIYLKPSVNVLGKNTIRLANPNGWYCLKSNTNVLGKAVIELHCKAKLAFSNTGATVLGSDQGEQQGTTVLGKTKIKRIGGC